MQWSRDQLSVREKRSKSTKSPVPKNQGLPLVDTDGSKKMELMMKQSSGTARKGLYQLQKALWDETDLTLPRTTESINGEEQED